jgi:hypothetical protein
MQSIPGYGQKRDKAIGIGGRGPRSMKNRGKYRITAVRLKVE